MKKFIYTISKLLLPILLLAYPLDIMLSTSLKNDPTFAFGEISTWNDIYNSKINSEILIMGSSRAYVHINPDEIERKLKKSTYNLGMNGNHFIMQNFRYNKYLMYNKPPKIIVHSIECGTLERNVELFNDNQYLPYMLFDTQMMRTTKEIIGFENFQYYLPLIRYYGRKDVVINYLTPHLTKNKVKRNKGYYGKDIKWDNKLIKKFKKNSIVDVNTIIAFEKFILDCKKKNIKLILVYSPEYIEGQSFIENRNDIINIYTKFSKKYQIPFLNYSNNFICLNDKYFYNNLHLNKNGSELFSKILANDLKIYLHKKEVK